MELAACVCGIQFSDVDDDDDIVERRIEIIELKINYSDKL